MASNQSKSGLKRSPATPLKNSKNKQLKPMNSSENQSETDNMDVDVKKLLMELKAGQDSMKQSIEQRIKNLSEEMNKTLNDRLKDFRDEFIIEMAKFENRVELLEKKIQTAETGKVEVKDYDPEVTVVIQNLGYEPNENLESKIDDIFQCIGVTQDQIPIVKMLRLTQREHGRNPIVKVQLESKEDKIRLLSLKQHLKSEAKYRRVYIRSSLSHAERVAQMNVRTILEDLHIAEKYRFTGSGKMVPRNPNNLNNPNRATFAEIVQNGGQTGDQTGANYTPDAHPFDTQPMHSQPMHSQPMHPQPTESW